MRNKGSLVGNFFESLFYTHLVLVACLVLYLTFRDPDHNRRFQPRIWHLLVQSSTACAGIIGFVWQLFTYLDPSRTFLAAFWLSPFLTSAFGIMLACVETPACLAAAMVLIVAGVAQSLYGCWASPRFDNSCRILIFSIKNCPPRVKTVVFLSLVVSFLYTAFLMWGIGRATAGGTKIDVLFIFLSTASLTWTMQVIKNAIQATVGHVKYMKFMCGIDLDYKVVVQTEAKYSIGSICLGSILVPVVTVARGLARAVSLMAGDVDEHHKVCKSMGICLRRSLQ
ncbi:uncharacterized protein LOC127256622 [Andrographis paniculata]|uniref:uncharacterized protein LOC127256622 n=1 Tax=Andrographis paniculata TaxID=175694 RepID=UPI0021E76CC2|nr:uncharacterized protein LOC127256622 [Andrographis paniculata]